MKKILIILVTHSSYSDVCTDFIKLFKKHWKDCNYDFVISVVGEDVAFEKERVIYNGKTCTLPGSIYSIMKNSDYDYCISFLGDAFINECISNEEIYSFMEEIVAYDIRYCCLIPRIAYRFKSKKFGKYLRYVSNNDVYNISFVAFLARKDFVEQEFCNNITDLEFEKKYLKESGNGEFFSDCAILTRNIFHLVAGIDKGKWNRHAYNKIRRKNRKIDLAERKKISYFKMFISDIYIILQIFISKKQRRVLKSRLSKFFHMKFSTKY